MKHSHILDIPIIYTVWQAPFIRQKIAPFLQYTDMSSFNSVLELGCGPATNTYLFKDKNYVGIDLSTEYITSAEKKYPTKKFIVGDVSQSNWPSLLPKFDAVFINSLLHHLSDETLTKTLKNINVLLRQNGRIFITDLVLPAEAGISRFLALADRGKFPRTTLDWYERLTADFLVEYFESFYLKIGPIKLWQMFFCAARLKHS